ncbi:MAG TPA: LytTR family DNA-binding domain-containing protein [Thermoanaerobaculia bacterium]|nr:LytTR family DNA-binding domain-containing protein [Thermoanaerobaculia bacterium]
MAPEKAAAAALRTLVVDDEAAARALLVEYLAAHPDVEVIAECADGYAAVKAAGDLHPDLLLLDVEMPKLNGFEVLELIAAGPAVVFSTAFDRYAVRAFEINAVDYLLKPFSAERLAEALARVRERRARGLGTPPRAAIVRAWAAGRPLERIVVRSPERIHVIPVERLDFIEARDDSVRLKAGSEEHLKAQPLAELESLLDPARFIRIHRSFLLNLDRLARLELYAKDSHVAILADGTRLPVSRAGYARLKPLL